MSGIKRNNSVDMARGVAILGVLYGHSLAWQGIWDGLSYWFWSFHMALFALCAGYFYKNRSIKETFINSCRTLLIPYIIVSIVLYMRNIALGGSYSWNGITHFIFQLCTLQFNSPCFWFIAALFNCKIIMSVANKIRWKYKNLLLALISIVIVFIPYHIEVYQLTRTFALLIFMIIGMYAKQYKILSWNINHYVAIGLLGVLVAARWLSMDIWGYRYPFGVLNFVTASIISYAVWYWCSAICNCSMVKVANRGQKTMGIFSLFAQFLSFCGQHSLMILSFQAVYGNKLVRVLSKHVGIENGYWIMFVFIVVCLISTYVLNRVITICKNRPLLKRITSEN